MPLVGYWQQRIECDIPGCLAQGPGAGSIVAAVRAALEAGFVRVTEANRRRGPHARRPDPSQGTEERYACPRCAQRTAPSAPPAAARYP